jgi:arylsulfatase A-like enzyme
VFTGISPHRSGLYRNGQKMREALPDAELLPKTFSKAGYWSGGSGKMLHYFIDARSWDEYFPAKETENPFPDTLGPPKRPVSLPRGGPWQYYETDWGPLDATDEEYGGDYSVSKWVGDRLSEKQDKPFFLACGIYRPHEPWFVPKKYFDAFPLDKIQLPPGYRADDLDDLPPAGKGLARNRYFAHIRAHKQWKQGIQGYLASIYFADAMLGRVLDALEKGPHADNTIVALWSDHGWHLGEKEHWQKFTAWRACSRVPFILRVPKALPVCPPGPVPSPAPSRSTCSVSPPPCSNCAACRHAKCMMVPASPPCWSTLRRNGLTSPSLTSMTRAASGSAPRAGDTFITRMVVRNSTTSRTTLMNGAT